MPQSIKAYIPHAVALVIFVIASLLYFNPVLQGKQIYQSDIVQYIGMAKQQNDFREATGEETYWTNGAFAGMPTYQLGARYPHYYIKKLDQVLRFLPRPADYLFLYFLGFYVLMLAMRIDTRLAVLGALGFGLSTYLVIILGVGHNAKAHAIAYMPLVLSGVVLTYRGKLLCGFVLTALAVGLELVANHFQMTYYLLLMLVCLAAAYGVYAFRQKQLPEFIKSSLVLLVAALIGAGMNATSLMATSEYAATSTRGPSALTINADGSPKENTKGLDYDYITEYSYGPLESLNLLIPSFMGGGSGDDLPQDGEAREVLLQMGASPQDAQALVSQIPAYWGDQTYVAAPAYIGAIVVFLAVLALFLVKGRTRWWIIAAALLSLLLSWGRHFPLLTDLFIDYIPLYDKFRAVSSIQVLLELLLPLLAVIGLQRYFFADLDRDKRQKALVYALSIVGGLTALFALAGRALFDFSNDFDQVIIDQVGLPFMEAVRDDRFRLMREDALRSLLLIALSGALLWLYGKGKWSASRTIAALAILIVADLGLVDRRYVNEEDFVPARVMKKPFEPDGADLQIAEDPGYFRVYDRVNNAISSGRASYFHQSIGGYHAAKPARLQDLFEFHIARGNIGVLNMLNVRYLISSNQGGGAIAQRNPYANGPAWLVEHAEVVDGADREILALDSLDTKRVAVVEREFADRLPDQWPVNDSLSSIELTEALPNRLTYKAVLSQERLAVFSEAYYPMGWQAYLDGAPVDHFRVNYHLRAMTIPKGTHEVEFRFEADVVQSGSTFTLATSLLFVLIVGGWWYMDKRRKQPAEN
jgi:hypothetical protein